MTNRRELALAVAVGYVLGRMKKGKLAAGVGGVLLGKRLNLSPGQLAGMISKQISANPQLAEIRDQLRDDLQGVGKSVKSALITRQFNSLSNSLRERTLDVRDRMGAGALTGRLSKGGKEPAGAKPEDDAYEARGEAEESRPRRESPAQKAPAKRAAAKKAPVKRAAAKKAPVKKATAKKATAKKTTSAGKKTASTAKKTASSARRTTSRRAEGDDRG